MHANSFTFLLHESTVKMKAVMHKLEDSSKSLQNSCNKQAKCHLLSRSTRALNDKTQDVALSPASLPLSPIEVEPTL